jgi:ATP-dependent Clp protease ATP-binding subunit ClpA
MLERFDATGSRALAAAADEARGLGHHYVGTEHLLLGVLAPR